MRKIIFWHKFATAYVNEPNVVSKDETTKKLKPLTGSWRRRY